MDDRFLIAIRTIKAQTVSNWEAVMSTTLVEEIEKPVIAVEAVDSKISAGAITNGSQVLAHDGYDVETFDRAAEEYTRLVRTVEETVGAIHTGSALLRDLFWSFHKRSPRIAPVAPLSPAQRMGFGLARGS